MTYRKARRIARSAGIVFCLFCATFTVAEVVLRDAHYQAACAALNNGDTEKAKRELMISLQQNPLDGKSHFLLASLLARAGELAQATVGYRQTAMLEPGNATARYNLATALLSREPVTAAQLLEEAVSIRPDDLRAYNNLGKAYALAGVPELALASYREVLRHDPSNTVARANLALITGAPVMPESPGSDRRVRNVDPSVAASPGSVRPPVAADASAGSDAHPDQVTGEVAAEVVALEELIRDLPHVTVEPRGGRGRLALTGWTSGPSERKLLDRILATRKDVLDLTGDDVGDPQRMIEVDAIIFKIIGFDSQSVGHNFLRRIEVNASVANGTVAGTISGLEWLFSAAIEYEVNIANASAQKVAFLARPHLTTLSGTPATFIAGGDIVFQVSGLNSGDIKPYPFGTTLEVIPTLLRTPGEDGSPRVRLSVKAGRRIFLTVQDLYGDAGGGSAIFENIAVTSEAVVGLNQTLILTGLNQRERRTVRSGVPGLMSIPVIKYLFSQNVTTTSDLAIVLLLTPRDPAFWDEQNRKSAAEFVERRRAFVQAMRGTDEDMRKFKERYPDWWRLAPNRLSSHFYLLEKSEAYRKVNGTDLADDSLDLDVLRTATKKK